jgi:hypothetical protein
MFLGDGVLGQETNPVPYLVVVYAYNSSYRDLASPSSSLGYSSPSLFILMNINVPFEIK